MKNGDYEKALNPKQETERATDERLKAVTQFSDRIVHK